MVCSRGHYVPDVAAENSKHGLAPVTCPRCAQANGDQGLREIQGEFLRKVIRGDFGYCLLVTKDAAKHAILYTTRDRTFCGLRLPKPPQIEKKPYDGATLTAMCPLCRSEIAAELEGVAR